MFSNTTLVFVVNVLIFICHVVSLVFFFVPDRLDNIFSSAKELGAHEFANPRNILTFLLPDHRNIN